MTRIGRNRIPRALLSDTITVEPYQAWNTWGTGYRQLCVLTEGSPQVKGDATLVAASLIALVPPEAWIPTGSRITVADGRIGYTLPAVGRGLTSPLPVPAHWEVQITVGKNAPSLIGGRSVTVLRRTVSGRDAYGNDTHSITPVVYDGVAVSPISSRGENDPNNNRVHRTCQLVFPQGADVRAGDRLIIDGQQWGVDAEPQVVADDSLNLTGGLVVTATRTTG